jgi:hypothetical protein
MATIAELKAARDKQRRTLDDLAYSADRDFERSVITPPRPDTGERLPERAKPPGYETRNPTTPEADPVADLFRGLRLGTQAVGTGAANLVGAPGDIVNLIANPALWTAEKVAGQPEGAYGRNPIAGGEDVALAFGDLIRKLAGPDALISEADMTPDERVNYRMGEFGTEALLGGAALGKAGQMSRTAETTGAPTVADAIPQSMLAPYQTTDDLARTVIGDTAAGAGSGLAMQSWRENAPESMQGPIADLVMALFGGAGGASTLRTAEGAGRLVAGTSDRLPVSRADIPPDPNTRLPVSRKTRNAAALAMQNAATDPAAASAEITRYLDEVGGPAPTVGTLTNDPGLLSKERQMRASNPDMSGEFIAQDRKVATAASEDVKSVRPEDGDPAMARTEAARQIDAKLGPMHQAVTDAAAALDVENANQMRRADEISGLSKDEASRALDRSIVDETYLNARERPGRGRPNRQHAVRRADRSRAHRRFAAVHARRQISSYGAGLLVPERRRRGWRHAAVDGHRTGPEHGPATRRRHA